MVTGAVAGPFEGWPATLHFRAIRFDHRLVAVILFSLTNSVEKAFRGALHKVVGYSEGRLNERSVDNGLVLIARTCERLLQRER